MKCDGDEIQRIIQIKVYLTNGTKEVEGEIEILRLFKDKHPNLKALLIIFNDLPKKSIIRDKLEEVKRDNDWFDYLILGNNDSLLLSLIHISEPTRPY